MFSRWIVTNIISARGTVLYRKTRIPCGDYLVICGLYTVPGPTTIKILGFMITRKSTTTSLERGLLASSNVHPSSLETEHPILFSHVLLHYMNSAVNAAPLSVIVIGNFMVWIPHDRFGFSPCFILQSRWSSNISVLSHVTGEWSLFTRCIRDVSGSNIGSENGYHDRFRVVLLSFSGHMLG
jgi:hypothetical protein